MSRELEAIVNTLVGRAVWQARLGPLGSDLLSIELAGGGQIRTEMASWRIETDHDFLIASEDHRNSIRGFVTELDGRRLTAVSVSGFLDLTLDFDGLRLIMTVTASARTDEQHWAIQLPSGDALFAGPARPGPFVGWGRPEGGRAQLWGS